MYIVYFQVSVEKNYLKGLAIQKQISVVLYTPGRYPKTLQNMYFRKIWTQVEKVKKIPLGG